MIDSFYMILTQFESWEILFQPVIRIYQSTNGYGIATSLNLTCSAKIRLLADWPTGSDRGR